MYDRPTGEELLQVARGLLLDDVLPHLPAEQRYNALMIANAIAITRREISQSQGVAHAEAELYRALFGEEGLRPGEADAPELRTRLAAELRTGRLDAELARVGELLLGSIKARLRVSNPKYLAGAGF